LPLSTILIFDYGIISKVGINLAPPFFAKMPASGQKSGLSCFCVLGVSSMPLSTISTLAIMLMTSHERGKDRIVIKFPSFFLLFGLLFFSLVKLRLFKATFYTVNSH
jgi:hypothetical protein